MYAKDYEQSVHTYPGAPLLRTLTTTAGAQLVNKNPTAVLYRSSRLTHFNLFLFKNGKFRVDSRQDNILYHTEYIVVSSVRELQVVYVL